MDYDGRVPIRTEINLNNDSTPGKHGKILEFCDFLVKMVLKLSKWLEQYSTL